MASNSRPEMLQPWEAGNDWRYARAPSPTCEQVGKGERWSSLVGFALTVGCSLAAEPMKAHWWGALQQSVDPFCGPQAVGLLCTIDYGAPPGETSIGAKSRRLCTAVSGCVSSTPRQHV